MDAKAGAEFVDSVERLAAQRAQGGPSWLDEARAGGLARFHELGLPARREEEWRHTSLAALAASRFDLAPSALPAPRELPELAGLDLGGARLVFIDGRYSAELSRVEGLPPGVAAGSIAAALADGGETLRGHLAARLDGPAAAFAALNTAFLADGAWILARRGAALEAPLHVVHLASGGADPVAAHPRTLIVGAPESRLRVVETFAALAPGRYLTNAVCQVELGDAARLDHVRVQAEADAAFHLASGESRQGRDSRYRVHHLHLGGGLVRHDLRAVLAGEGADCVMNGLHLALGRRHLDSHTVIEHAAPHGTSRELYKGILCDEARSVFKGRIVVRRDAQKTDAVQSNPNLLLSDRALAHSLPQLEIYADDVKCTHGATIGRLDEEAVFYLRSRGIADAEARRLLIHAFVGELLEHIEIDVLRDEVGRRVAALLPAAVR